MSNEVDKIHYRDRHSFVEYTLNFDNFTISVVNDANFNQ